MVVLQICCFISECPGVFIPTLEHLAKKIEKMESKIIFAFPEEAREKKWCVEMQKKYKIYFLPYDHLLKNIKVLKGLNHILKENKVDIIHSHHDLYDLPAIMLAKNKIKVFIHLHNAIDTYEKKGHIENLKKKLRKVIFKRAYLVSVSEEYRQIMCNRKFDESKSKTIANGINIEKIVKSENYNKRYDFLLFASDFYGKGGDVFIEACEKLVTNGYNIKVALCGGGREGGWKEVDEFLGTKKVEWLEKKNVVENVNDLYLESRVFVSASRKETFSTSICESAYSGLNIISSDIVGVKWAKDLKNISFFKDGDVDELYLQMKKQLDFNKKIDIESITKNRALIEEKYSMETWCNKIIDIYLKD